MQITAFSSVQLLSRVRLFVTPGTAAHQASLSITNSQSPPKPMSIESVMPASCLILCRPLLPPSIFPSIRDFSNESALITALGTRISNEQALHTESCVQVEKRSLFEIFARKDTYYQSTWRHRIFSPGSKAKYGDPEAPRLGQFWQWTHGWPWGLEGKVSCVCLQKPPQSRHRVSIQ